MPNPLTIAIDGPSGSGKSTTARMLATQLGLAYLDTGAMYRAVAVLYRQRELDPSDGAGIAGLVADLDLEIGTSPDEPRFRVAGSDVTATIREPAVSECVSVVATNPEVRRVLTDRMREEVAAAEQRIVLEGRDVTTVVTPDAQVRVLLVADPAARVARRQAELGEQVDTAAVTDQVIRRDADDSTVSNFVDAAPGVSVIDSTFITPPEVVARIVELIPSDSP